MTARDVVRALYRHYTPRWAVWCEVTATDENAAARVAAARDARGYRDPDAHLTPDRRIDVLLLRGAGKPLPAADRLERVALEGQVEGGGLPPDGRRPAQHA